MEIQLFISEGMMLKVTEQKQSPMKIANQKVVSRRNVWSGILFGVGLIAFIDEVVFHQLLHWHHFYDLSTTSVGLISDGLFHAFSWFATIAGLFLFADLRRQNALSLTRWCGGIFLGAGIFQLYDGIVQHKLMRIHQIRYVDHVVIYDIVWNLFAITILVIGFILIKRTNPNQQDGGKTTIEHS